LAEDLDVFPLSAFAAGSNMSWERQKRGGGRVGRGDRELRWVCFWGTKSAGALSFPLKVFTTHEVSHWCGLHDCEWVRAEPLL
jgi:hypothetical protein